MSISDIRNWIFISTS